MNIKSKISKLVSGLLCFSMIFSNVLPAYAADAVITENTLDGEDLSVNETNLEDITVTYKQASSFFVTIPKTIVLDGWKQSTYAVKVSGDIDAEQCVYVAPVDMIDKTENIDFYMKDQASENAKDDVVASVTHKKSHWNSAEVAEGHKQDDNLVSAPDLTAGAWKGIFQIEIKLETHVTHKHNYVQAITKEPTCTEAGEKKYTCDCGDCYTEVIPAKGHHFEDGECTDCGEKDADYHKHSYTETITKQPTCTEAGEKKYTCDCGDSYTEVIPAKGHHFVDGECTDCGEKDSDYHEHSYDEGVVTKKPTCTEKGEKTFTCSECGHTYTEEIPATGHNYENNICTNCGETDPNHIHNYEPYKYILEPKLVSSTGGSTYGTKWYLTGHGSASDYGSIADYDSYYCRDAHPGRYYSSDLRATFNINMPEDYEGAFDYQYFYSVTRNTTSGASVQLKVNGTYVYENIDGSITGTGSATKTEPLSAGENTFVVDFYTYNKNSTNSYLNTSQLSNATLKMYKIALYDGSEYHICDTCGTKEVHKFVDGVCIECGWKEGEHTHHYVDGVCDKCGKAETQYNLVLDDSDYFINGIDGLSVNKQYIRDGDIFNLPEKTADGYDMDGYLIMKPLRTIYMCTPSKGHSSNAGDTYSLPNEAIWVYACQDHTITEADNKYGQWASVGLKTGDTSSYGWNQTAETDIIEIDKPCVYVLDVMETDSDSTAYTINDYKNYGITLHDITNGKEYNLLNLAGASQQTYDYGNVQIVCKRVCKNTSYSYAKVKSYRDVFMIYLQAGRYKLSSYGKIGNNNAQCSNVHEYYWQRFCNPVLSSEALAAPVVNNVTDYVQSGCLYELVPVQNGQKFDYAQMYTDKVASNNQNIYLISNWIAK